MPVLDSRLLLYDGGVGVVVLEVLLEAVTGPLTVDELLVVPVPGIVVPDELEYSTGLDDGPVGM